MRYTLISSYFHRPGEKWAPWLFKLWWDNILRHADPLPTKTVIIAVGGCRPPKVNWSWKHRNSAPEIIHLEGDTGHCDHLLKGVKHHFMPAAVSTWMAGAWLAYLNETDAIFLEQDALAFGDWVKRLDRQLDERYSKANHGRGVVVGPSAMQGASTSLWAIRHWFIPQFIQDYLWLGQENIIERITETKMNQLCEIRPEHYVHHGFTFGKDRPVPDWFNRATWPSTFWIEKATPAELMEIKVQGLLSFNSMPSVEVFSNHL